MIAWNRCIPYIVLVLLYHETSWVSGLVTEQPECSILPLDLLVFVVMVIDSCDVSRTNQFQLLGTQVKRYTSRRYGHQSFGNAHHFERALLVEIVDGSEKSL